jgi:hypothetical protein
MKEITGDLWDYWKIPDTAICITTNGFVKANGECVMGRGCALEAKARMPMIASVLGALINKHGNHVHRIYDGLYSFPVKHAWYEKADLKLIERSCKEISDLATEKHIVIPRPGCGNGKLSYSDVCPILEKELDDRFSVITFKKRNM